MKIANALFLIWHVISTQWIAILTLLTTILMWRHEHESLIVEVDPTSSPVAGILLDDGRSIINDQFGMQHLNLWFVNPSSSDISYYDLRVTLGTSPVQLYTAAQFNYANDLKDAKPVGLITYGDNDKQNQLIGAALPQNHYGTIPAHGFVGIDLVFTSEQAPLKAMVLMKLASSHTPWQAFRHSRFAPACLRSKIGYIHSETKEISRLFHVVKVVALENPNDDGTDNN